MLLKRAYEKSVPLTIEDDLQEIELYTGRFEICGQVGQTVSIIPVNEKACLLYTSIHTGIAWEGSERQARQEGQQIHWNDCRFR